MAKPNLPWPVDHLSADVLSPANVYTERSRLVERERLSLASWQLMNDKDRSRVLAAIRVTLLRLLEDAQWVPGSLVVKGGSRIDFTFSVTLDDAERLNALDFVAEGMLETLLRMDENLSGPSS